MYAYWGLFYSGGLNDPGDGLLVGGLNELNTIIQKCQSDPAGSSVSGFPANQIAAATILRAWIIQNMTDAWGDIPYSQALKPDEFRAPKYDSQSEIYSGLMSEINEAIALINTGEAGPVNDLIYGGDMDLWQMYQVLQPLLELSLNQLQQMVHLLQMQIMHYSLMVKEQTPTQSTVIGISIIVMIMQVAMF